jgi:hypothetical protein
MLNVKLVKFWIYTKKKKEISKALLSINFSLNQIETNITEEFFTTFGNSTWLLGTIRISV